MELLIASLVDGLLLGFVYGLAAMGLALIWGVMDVINLSHGPIIALGMFGVYLSFYNLGLNPYLALFLVAAGGLLLGVIIYFVAVNRVIDAPHLSTLLATFSVNMIIIGIGTAVFTTSPQNVEFSMGTLVWGPINVTWTRIASALVAILVAGLMYLFLYRTRPGKHIRAVANNKEAAELMGIPSTQVLALSFGLGTMLAAISGGLIATLFSFSILKGGTYELKSFVIGVLGGLGNPLGALAGGMILGFLEGLIPVYLPTTWVPVLEFGLFVVVLLILPAGLFGSDKSSVRRLGITSGVVLLALFLQLVLKEVEVSPVFQWTAFAGVLVLALLAMPQQGLYPLLDSIRKFFTGIVTSAGNFSKQLQQAGKGASGTGRWLVGLVQRYGFWLTLVLVIALTIWPIATDDAALRESVFTILVMISLASSLNILLGYTGYVSFGHIVFFGLGGYLGMYLLNDFGTPLFLAVLAGGLFAGLMAFLLGKAILRLRGAYFALATIGVNEAAKAFVNNFEPFGGPTGIELNFAIYQNYGGLGNMLLLTYWSMFALTLFILIISFLVKASKFGLGLMAIRENEDAAEVMGVVAPNAKTWAYVLSAIGPGMVGVLFFFKTSSIEPHAAFRLHLSIETIVMVMLGGQGTLLGPVLGAAGYQVLRKTLLTSSIAILGVALKEIQLVVAGILLLIIILFVPAGVVGWLRNQFYELRKVFE